MLLWHECLHIEPCLVYAEWGEMWSQSSTHEFYVCGSCISMDISRAGKACQTFVVRNIFYIDNVLSQVYVASDFCLLGSYTFHPYCGDNIPKPDVESKMTPKMTWN